MIHMSFSTTADDVYAIVAHNAWLWLTLCHLSQCGISPWPSAPVLVLACIGWTLHDVPTAGEHTSHNHLIEPKQSPINPAALTQKHQPNQKCSKAKPCLHTKIQNTSLSEPAFHTRALLFLHSHTTWSQIPLKLQVDLHLNELGRNS